MDRTLRRAVAEVSALKAVCAVLIAEVAALHPNPSEAVDRICSRLAVVAENVAGNPEVETLGGSDFTLDLTEVMDQLRTAAEDLVASARGA